MQGSHAWRADSALFDEDNLVSCAGLVPLLELAEQAGLSQLLDEHVRFACERVKSGAANSTPKLTSIIAGMAAGADSIDDLDVIRAGGMKKLFGGIYAATTLGIFLREFTHGHTRQLSAVLRRHLVALAEQTPVLAGIDERAFIDIDSLLRPVYGHAKQGASFGHTKIAGKAILRRGLSPLAVTISTPTAAPVLAGVRLRAGRAGSGKGAASMVTEAINTATDAGAQAHNLLVRGDSAFCSGKVIAAVVKAGATFSFAIARNPAVDAAISSIGDEQYKPVHYPGAVTDPDTGQSISDAQVSEVEYTAFAGTQYEITGRLIVRRVLDANTQDPLFPVWRYHPFFTNNPEPVTAADITHRRHAICETVWSDLIDGPWAHQPSGSFGANAAWTILAAICHNLLRAAGTLTHTARYARARGATLRTHLINLPARLARPQRRPVLHLPAHWPRAQAWLTLWNAVFTT
ncbi:IS1380 family transposase [Micromonospora sp. NPDC047707]|uniref:IS1380 family transposase n=1 Tax=Micromonospora sp. NPDC047707 TaxID=3154498 RepID=UPI003451AF28